MAEKKDNVLLFKSHEQLGFDFVKEQIAPIGQTEKRLKKDKEWFKKYAQKEWLDHYHVMRLLALSEPEPSLVTSYSDMPKAPQGGFYSETEELALKSLEASEWLDFFHKKLDLLPELHKEIIIRRDLEKNQHDGKSEIHDLIYPELGLSRSLYHEKRSDALYWLGISLLQGINVKKKMKDSLAHQDSK